MKYEEVYLHGYQNIPEAREGLRRYFEFYNRERFHRSLDYKTPWQVYSGEEYPNEKTPVVMAAKSAMV